MQPPGFSGALLWQQVAGALHVARGEAEKGLRWHRRVAPRHCAAVAVALHVAQQPADVAGGQVGLQRPRRIGVAEGERQIGHVAEHHALVDHGLAGIEWPPVDGQRHIVQHVQLQAGGQHHDIGREFLAAAQAQSTGGEALDGVRHHRRAALAHGPEQIAIGRHAHALVPRVVVRREVVRHVHLRPQFLCSHRHQPLLHLHRPAPGETEIEAPDQHVLPARQAVGQAGGQPAEQRLRDAVLRRPVDDVGGRALQHRHMGRCARHLRHQCHRGGTAADHHHALVAVVQAGRPELGLDHATAKVGLACKGRAVATGVAVVAAAQVQKTGPQSLLLAGLAVFDLHRPAGLIAAPGGAAHPLSEADVAADVGLVGSFADVAQDGRAIGNGLRLLPRLERVTQRVHVRIRAHAGVAEQVPSAADGVARLDDGVAVHGTLPLQVVRGTDARQAGADDQHVEQVFLCSTWIAQSWCAGSSRRRWCRVQRVGRQASRVLRALYSARTVCAAVQWWAGRAARSANARCSSTSRSPAKAATATRKTKSVAVLSATLLLAPVHSTLYL